MVKSVPLKRRHGSSNKSHDPVIRKRKASKFLYGNETFDVRCIKEMKSENGQRWWLVAWAGEQDDGLPWEDSWEPSSCVPSIMRQRFLARRKARVDRSILVDTSPLDLKVKKVVAKAVEGTKPKEKGQQKSIEVPALSLTSIARNYLENVAAETGCGIQETYDPSDKVTTWQLNMTDPQTIGKWCSFEQTMVDEARAEKKKKVAAKGVGSLRHGGGRAHNCDMAVVGVPLVLRASDNSQTPGLCNFEVEFPTVYFNGIYGTPEIPHMNEGMLKDRNNLNSVVAYVRVSISEKG